MKRFTDTHVEKDGTLRKYSYFKSEVTEVIIFDYCSGQSVIFIRKNKPDSLWIETTASMGSSSGAKQAYSGQNVFEEYIQDFKVWVDRDEGFCQYATFDFGVLRKGSYPLINVEYMPLPDRLLASRVYYTGTEYIVIARQEFIRDYKTHIWIGDLARGMRRQEIKEELRYRDGGTTFITTDEGVLFWPSSFKSKASINSTWTPNDGTEEPTEIVIEQLDLENLRNPTRVKLILEKINVHRTKMNDK